jgi:hypothetical protein
VGGSGNWIEATCRYLACADTIQATSSATGGPQVRDIDLISCENGSWPLSPIKAINPAGRLLIVEMLIPPGDTPHPGKMLDMAMLVQFGGQERTSAEYGLLLGKAGFRLARVVPTESVASIVEAVVA